MKLSTHNPDNYFLAKTTAHLCPFNLVPRRIIVVRN